MKINGTQHRESLSESGFRLIRREFRAVVLENPNGVRELWHANNHAAHYVVQIGRWGYEFGKIMKDTGILNLHRDVPAFTRAYITCALWSSTDDSGSPLDRNYNWTHIADATLRQMVADCERFMSEQKNGLATIGGRAEQNGHDFWRSRNGHGAGFFDRECQYTDFKVRKSFGKAIARLQKAAKAFGEFGLLVGDGDGKIYH